MISPTLGGAKIAWPTIWKPKLNGCRSNTWVRSLPPGPTPGSVISSCFTSLVRLMRSCAEPSMKSPRPSRNSKFVSTDATPQNCGIGCIGFVAGPPVLSTNRPAVAPSVPSL